MSAGAMTYQHRWIPAPSDSARTFLLLHGTGGDENDLVPLARMLDPEAAVLSPRGNVLENGAPRFFRRHGVGKLDLDDLARRTQELAGFVQAAASRYGFALDETTAVGFSNGANIAASMLFETPRALGDAILIRAMLPYTPPRTPETAGKRILLLAGKHDPDSGPESTEALAGILREGGAEVSVHYADAGHELTQKDVARARAWLAEGRA